MEHTFKRGDTGLMRCGYEAEVVADDMGGDAPLLVRYRGPFVRDSWPGLIRLAANGRRYKHDEASPLDLMPLPPPVTDEELAAFRVAWQSAEVKDMDSAYRAGLAAAFAVREGRK